MNIVAKQKGVKNYKNEGVIKLLYDDICESCAEARSATCDYCRLNPYCNLSISHIEYVRKTGKWFNDSRFTAVDEYGEEITFVEQQCSNCFRWNIRIDRHVPRKYCPHCGAVMD